MELFSLEGIWLFSVFLFFFGSTLGKLGEDEECDGPVGTSGGLNWGADGEVMLCDGSPGRRGLFGPKGGSG